MIQELSKLLESKGVKRFVHFHTDHWEPFSGDWEKWGEQASENADVILDFIEETEYHPFFDKMTLFYYHPVRTASRNEDNIHGDLLDFMPQNPPFWERYSNAVRRVAQDSSHEFQVHIHHEGITNGDFFKFGHLPWPENQDTLAKDTERLERYIQTTLQDMRSVTGLPLKDWHFLHGVWALNASDTSVCTIVEEIELLIRNGCIGDFSMPAGRRIVDSTIKAPHTVIPVNAVKGYDLPEAEPKLIGEKPSTDEKRFLIWNQDIPFTHCTIDHHGSEWIADALEDWEDTIRIWIEGSPVIGDTAFIKTHAHTMNRLYWGDEIPRTYNSPSVLNLFTRFTEVCAAAGVEYAKWTVSEVMDYLLEFDPWLKHSLRRDSNPSIITEIN